MDEAGRLMQLLASFVLALHLLWILWVIFGAFWTRGRLFLAAFHVLSLLWGIIVELSSLPCPLTLAEQFLEDGARASSYHGAFLMHFLDRLVYPDFPEIVLVVLGVVICSANLGVYVRRYWKSRSAIAPSS